MLNPSLHGSAGLQATQVRWAALRASPVGGISKATKPVLCKKCYWVPNKHVRPVKIPWEHNARHWNLWQSSIQNLKKEPLMFYQSLVAAPEECKLSCQFNSFISLKFHVKSKFYIAPNPNFLSSRNHTGGLIKGYSVCALLSTAKRWMYDRSVERGSVVHVQRHIQLKPHWQVWGSRQKPSDSALLPSSLFVSSKQQWKFQ